MQNGVVTSLDTDYVSGPVAKAISRGAFAKPIIFRTHGDRSRAIECSQLHIDVVFLAAPTADPYGNISGQEGTFLS